MRRHTLSLVLCGLYGFAVLVFGVMGAFGTNPWAGFTQIVPVLPIPILLDRLGLAEPWLDWLLTLDNYSLLALLASLHLLVLFIVGWALTRIGAAALALKRGATRSLRRHAPAPLVDNDSGLPLM